MGTNYYAIPEVDDDKKQTLVDLIQEGMYGELQNSIPEKEVHIGKSSAGWQFCFNHNNWRHYDSLKSLKEFIKECKLVTEYREEVTPEEFWNLVKVKKEGLYGDKYERDWDKIHPGESKPYHMISGMKTDVEWFGLRFSTSDDFS